MTLNLNFAVHQIHQVLRDRHAQSGSVHGPGHRIVRTFKRLKQMLHEFRIHTDSRIAALEDEILISFIRTWTLTHFNRNPAA